METDKQRSKGKGLTSRADVDVAIKEMLNCQRFTQLANKDTICLEDILLSAEGRELVAFNVWCASVAILASCQSMLLHIAGRKSASDLKPTVHILFLNWRVCYLGNGTKVWFLRLGGGTLSCHFLDAAGWMAWDLLLDPPQLNHHSEYWHCYQHKGNEERNSHKYQESPTEYRLLLATFHFFVNGNMNKVLALLVGNTLTDQLVMA